MTKGKISVWLMTLTAILSLLGACKNNESDKAEGSRQINKPQVFFIDVGKGDAALIGLPGGYWVMIDTGPIEGFPEIGRTLMRQGVTHLDAVFITHGHKDHIGGLNSVLGMAGTFHVYTIPDCLDDEEISEATKDEDIEAAALTAGSSVQVGDAVFEVLGPAKDYGEENENSMVLMFEYHNTRILFTADQMSEAQDGLVKSGKVLKADVLKVAYHGSAESTSAEFVKAVSPKFAVVPTDDSRPPAQQTLDKLSHAGTKTFVLGDTGTLVYNGDSITRMPEPSDETPNVSVSKKNVKAEFIMITNHTAQPVDLAGWCLYSENGAETYFFPAGSELPPSGSVTVFSGEAAEGKNDGLNWTKKKIWSNKAVDVCQVYDAYGRLVCSG